MPHSILSDLIQQVDKVERTAQVIFIPAEYHIYDFSLQQPSDEDDPEKLRKVAG